MHGIFQQLHTKYNFSILM